MDANNGRDLHVRVVSRRLVKASDSSVEPHVLAASNLDLLYCTFQAFFVCVYPRQMAGDFDSVVATFLARLPSFLDHFFPLAGRIVTDRSSGLPEVHCSNQGAELVVGEASVALASLDFSNLDASLQKVWLPYDDGAPLSVQLVSFPCGGFSVTWRVSHLLMDGHAMYMCVNMWSEFARNGTLPAGAAPCHDRSVLFLPRSPPSYRPSFGEAYTPDNGARLVNVLTNESFVERLYYIEARDIVSLRSAASREGGQSATRMEAVSAYLWKALAAVVGSADELCRMGWWVDGRRRLTSPEHRAAVRNYAGNVTSFAVGEARVKEIRHAPLQDVASLVHEAISSAATEEHFQELVDWLEVHKSERYLEAATVGLGSPAVTVTSMASFPLDTDFGFGRAALAMPTFPRGRTCSALFVVAARPGCDGSWFVSAFAWPRLAAALETDEKRIFKPVTAEYLGLTSPNAGENGHCSEL